MIFDRKELQKTLTRARAGVSTRPGIPALTGILVSVREGRARMVTTDLETTVRLELAGREEVAGETWSALIPAKLWAESVRSATGPEFPVHPGKDGRVTLGPAEVLKLVAEDFPKIGDVDSAGHYFADAAEFASALESVIPAASRDLARPILTGVLFEGSFDRGTVTITATDSYRLHSAEISATTPADSKMLVPHYALKSVGKMIGRRLKVGEASIYITPAEGRAVFTLPDGSEVITRLIEGEFPNWRQLLPDGMDTYLEYDRAELAEILKQASPFAGDRRGIQLELREGRPAVVVADSPDLGRFVKVAEGSRWLGAAGGIELERLIVGFNPDYLADVISAVNGPGPHSLEIRNGLKPACVRSTAAFPTAIALLMPVRPPSGGSWGVPSDIPGRPISVPA